MKAIVTVDLGFGDSGKGAIVDALVRKYDSKLVVRYSGGHQSAHAVTLEDGRVHRFSQWGAGTLAGAMTYLGRDMIIEPKAMLAEAADLYKYVCDPWAMLQVSPECLVTTIFHRLANRCNKETLEHGSCGVGIGETRKYWLQYGQDAIVAGDMIPGEGQARKLLSKLRLMAERYEMRHQVDMEYEHTLLQQVGKLQLPGRIVELELPVQRDGVVIFEAAQGVLIDQKWGKHPHTTWSDTTTWPAHEMIQIMGNVFHTVRTIGIIRAYATRHGNGPFPTEMSSTEAWELGLEDLNNPTHDYQGHMRYGWPDLPMLEYALEHSQCDMLAVNCVDQVEGKTMHVRCGISEGMDPWSVARARNMLPSEWTALPWDEIQEMINKICPIGIIGRGPKASDKHFSEIVKL